MEERVGTGMLIFVVPVLPAKRRALSRFNLRISPEAAEGSGVPVSALAPEVGAVVPGANKT